LHRRQFGNTILSALAACSQSALSLDKDESDPILTWIRKQAWPLRGTSPDLLLNDLAPFKRAYPSVQVVGVGENNHGCSEYQAFKHGFFRFLVKEMGFKAFALESSYSSCRAIDDYVIHGTGRLEDVLTGQGYTAWDTLEMSALLSWMRDYNQSVSPEQKVRFFGLDVSYNERGRKNVLAWLKHHAPDRVPKAETLLDSMGEEDQKWPARTNSARVKTLVPDIQALADSMREIGKNIPPPADPLEDAVWDMTVIEQWVVANSGGVGRAECMGQNLGHLLDCYPGIRVLVSTFNHHISTTAGTVGGLMRERLGKSYYSLAAEFGTGSFRVRSADGDHFFNAYREITPPPAPEQSVPWYLTQSEKGSLLLDLRERATIESVRTWIDKPEIMHSAVWAPTDARVYDSFNLPQLYDGIYFIDRIKPSRPTANGNVAARERLRF
jgi:erythromycin esterase